MSVYCVQGGRVWQSLSGEEQILAMMEWFTYLQYVPSLRSLLADTFARVVAECLMDLFEGAGSTERLRGQVNRDLV